MAGVAHADNAQTIYYFCLGDLPSQKHHALQAKAMIVSRSDWCFCFRRSRRQNVRARLRLSSERSEPRRAGCKLGRL